MAADGTETISRITGTMFFSFTTGADEGSRRHQPRYINVRKIKIKGVKFISLNLTADTTVMHDGEQLLTGGLKEY